MQTKIEQKKTKQKTVQAQPLRLDEKCKKLEKKIQRVATNTIGYTRKQANKEWFDEKCAKVNQLILICWAIRK
jgi:acetoacetate decarboxylase